MKTELVDHSPTRKELKIEVAAAEVRAEYDRVSDYYAARVNVPGFRKGHAPRAVVRQRYKNEIRSEVVQNLVPRAVNEALVENNLNAVREPEVHLENDAGLEQFGAQPLAIHVHVEVLPEVELGRYKGLAAARRVRPVTDADIDEWLERMREAGAGMQPVEERGAELGDTVAADFLGKYIEPQEPDDINVSDVEVELGGEGVVPEFTEHLLGVRADEVKTFRVQYPEPFERAPGLAGKLIEYTATVTAVRRKELPTLDDEWAQSLGEEIESLADLRAKLREDFERRAAYEAEQRVRGELLRTLVAAHQFEVPESLVKSQARRLLESTVRDMAQHGIDPRSPDINWENMQGVFETQAAEDVRESYLLERIAEAEQIEVADEEIAQEIERIAQASRQSVEQVRAALTKQGGERSIADRLRHRKALDLIAAAAQVTDAEWREEEPPAPAESEAGAPEATTSDEPATSGESAAGEQQASAAAGSEAEQG